MFTTSSAIIRRALGLADAVNATNITQNDKVNSLNESWKDVYNLMIDSDDDYILTEIVIPVLPSYVNTTSVGQYLEYNIPLPSDVMRIRYVDYPGGIQWYPMDKYPMSMKDFNPGTPMYRWRNGNLNVIGGPLGAQLSQIRVGYYPAPVTMTLPADPFKVGSTLTLAQQTSLVSPSFTNVYTTSSNINQANGALGKVVYYNGTAIVAEDEDLGTTTTLYTGANITQVAYYQGWVVFLQSGSLYGFMSDLVSVGVPALIVTPGVAPTRFSILVPNPTNTPANYNPPLLLWCSDVSTFSSIYQTTGALVSTVAQGYSSFFNYANKFYAVDPSGNLYRFDGTSFLISAGVRITGAPTLNTAASDGVAIYAGLPFTTEIHAYTLDGLTLKTDVTVVSDANISTLFNVLNGKLTYERIDSTFWCASTDGDTIISYPNNIVPELISFQAAIDFRAKQQADTSALSTRQATLFTRYKDSLRRDDYQAERVKNDYQATNWYFFR